jgi:endonuclease G, mitochondrial
LPQVTRAQEVAPLVGVQDYVLAYEHFSIVMHRQRRLALFTASNVDGSNAARRPDPNRKYTRAALGGFGPNDLEEWVSDPRLAAQYQVPDIFYVKDRGAFDRGHLVRRDDVCFGATYAQVQRANGDTYHMTNCSPQVNGYNRSDNGVDNWGDLENVVLSQAKTERYCLFAGPVFDERDGIFSGSGANGPISLQIPRSYWKVVVAVKNGALQAFAFVLEQDLSAVSFESNFPESQVIDDPRVLEFLPPPEFTRTMVPLRTLEAKLGSLLQFPAALHAADQYQLESAIEVARSSRIERLS